MAMAASEIGGVRSRFFEVYLRQFEALRPQFALPESLSLGYRVGWDSDTRLERQLEAARDKDPRLGYSSVGPHRDDLTLTSDSRSALNALSRGEQKAFMLCFTIALRQFVTELSGDAPLLLVDDLGAELDESRQVRILSLLGNLDGQVLVTSVARPIAASSPETRVFHVEQGAISK